MTGATAEVTIAATKGLTASFDPAGTTLPVPGPASTLLLVHNTGNLEDAYQATIVGTTGPITASLQGLDGQPTQSIPLFRLPGLSNGAIPLDCNLQASGVGTVTVKLTSLSDPSIQTFAMATINMSTVTIDRVVIAEASEPKYGTLDSNDQLVITWAFNGAASVGSESLLVDNKAISPCYGPYGPNADGSSTSRACSDRSTWARTNTRFSRPTATGTQRAAPVRSMWSWG